MDFEECPFINKVYTMGNGRTISASSCYTNDTFHERARCFYRLLESAKEGKFTHVAVWLNRIVEHYGNGEKSRFTFEQFLLGEAALEAAKQGDAPTARLLIQEGAAWEFHNDIMSALLEHENFNLSFVPAVEVLYGVGGVPRRPLTLETAERLQHYTRAFPIVHKLVDMFALPLTA